MLAILKRELKVYYTSLFAYIYYAAFFLVTGVFFSASCLETYSTEFGYYVIGIVFYVMVLILPFCTMKLFSLERKHKTDQLLFTAPVSSFAVLFAKYLATVIFALLPLVLSALYPIIISNYGTMSARFVIASYIGCFLSVLVMLSVGMFISTLTTNVVLAVVISYIIYAVVLLSRVVEGVVGTGVLFDVVHETSVYNKFHDMISGIVRSGDIVYLLALSVMFFLFTWIVLESRRQSLAKMIMCTVIVILFGGTISFFAFKYTKVYDFTAEQLLSVSEDTVQIVSDLDKPVDIYYMGKESTANATYREFLDIYSKLNDKVTVHYKNIAEDNEFREKYLPTLSQILEASILVVCDERCIYLNSADYVKTTQVSQYTTENSLQLENQLTSAIYYASTTETNLLTVVTGHDEESLNSDFTNMLYLNGYKIKDLDITAASSSIHALFSDDCNTALINAPQSDYLESEINELETYLENGGNLFVILDPLNEDLPNLYAFLKKYGLDIEPGIVIEKEEGRYAYETPYYLIPKLQKSIYTDAIYDKNLTILGMTSKGIIPDGSGNGYTSTDILMTSGKAFAKKDDYENMDSKGENDVGGPFSIASCATKEDAGSIFLMTTNVFFNEQADTESSGANRKFFLEIMKQLTNAESTIWIDGKLVGNQVALYPYGSRTIVKVITIIVLPVLIILVGIVIMIVRKKNLAIRSMKKRVEDDEQEVEADKL